ncbi:uncharacterized protein LOC132304189 isoform X2 [Cornus florida]|uniref:uncharacterized protein LOC132304189 isoform X2 n=1 Tax=Cornus florida TaxID=4283 RepID=UPI00289EF82B|nr:uncharacterized protein LOC132304189 isoform X2 [Cornus florida]
MRLLGFTRRFDGNYTIKTLVNSHLFESSRKRALHSDSNYFNGHDSILPVLIVGAGPVGLVLSILLTKLGIKCGVLEKSKTFSNHPQAHFINNRSMEVFRKLDGLAEEIQKSQPPVDLWRKFIYCTSLSGSILGSVDHMQPQDFEKVVSPVSVAHFSQYKLTRLLLKQLENLNFHVHTYEGSKGFNHGPIREREILIGHDCVSIDATDRSVTVTASFLKEGKYVEKNIECGILVGCDGAGSTVRKLAGIDLTGEKDLQKLVSVHFVSRDLGWYLLTERPGMLFFIFNTEAIGVLVAHDLKEGEFVFQIPYYPPQQKLEDFNSQMCERLIIKLVGRELADIDVIDIKQWVMHAEVAEKFVSFDNRIILAGDAAHRFPPAGGFVHRVINSGVGSILPSELQRAILDGIFTLGRAQLSDSVLNEKNPLGSLRLARLRRIFEGGQSLQLQFPAEDLGFRYIQGAIVPDSESVSNAPETPTGRRRDYVPRADPGSRLPHMNVRVLSKPSSEETFSTLDLVCGDKIEFLLIVAPLEESYHLAHAAFNAAEKFKVSVRVCIMWPDGTDCGVVGSKTELIPWENYIDVKEVKQASTSLSWWDTCQMTDRGAILVRPDEHIAWRANSRVTGDLNLEMKNVFSAVLGLYSIHI